MDNVKLEILNLFNDVMLNTLDTMDSKTLNYWTNAISRGSKSLDDLNTFLLKSQDYTTAVKNTFVDIFYDKIGGDGDYQTLLRSCTDNFRDQQIHREDIYKYIVESSEFSIKYKNIIQKVYEAITNKQPDHEITIKLLQKFQQLPEYSIDDLKIDISEGLRDDDAKDVDDALNSEEFNPDQQQEIIALWNDKSKFLEFYRKLLDQSEQKNPVVVSTSSICHNDNDEKYKFITIFESVYGSSMFALEYVLYTNAFINKANLLNEIKILKEHHDEMFSNVREISAKYLNESMEEQEFIRTYLPHIQDDNFVENLKNKILSSEQYKTKMTQKLSGMYQSMYGESLGKDESEYIFNKVKQAEYDLLNEDVNTVLVEYKNETDSFTERIFRIFIDTFEREPDIHELPKYVQMYRVHGELDSGVVDKMVESELVASLEYHDVIKQKIKNIYAKIKNTSILPSVLFNILNKALEQHGNYPSVGEWIENYIQEL